MRQRCIDLEVQASRQACEVDRLTQQLIERECYIKRLIDDLRVARATVRMIVLGCEVKEPRHSGNTYGDA